LFTDIEGSTPLLARLGSESYQMVLEQHRGLIRQATRQHGGVEIGTEGDGMFFAFGSADEGVAACCEAQRALVGHLWPFEGAVRVRMGLHTGQATITRDGEYVGLAVHQAARVMTVAHGGQVLASRDVLAGLVVHGQVKFEDLGEFSVRDFEGATRLYQLCHDELPSSFPPPRAPSAAVHNLGAQRSSFVGRDEELDTLAGLLGSASLVTIVGPGGMGKTRFATEAGLRLAGRYPAGVWLVSLASLSDPRLLCSTVASALGVVDRSGRSVEETVIARLSRSATLLIVDNCEHLIDGCAGLVGRLLQTCPELTVLATSRERLDLGEEHVLRLSSLSDSAALALLTERAAQARRGFTVTAGNSEAVTEICRQLEGMPLALELAAARLAAFSPTQVAVLLADTLAVLDVGRRDADARHRTLRAALDWSYQLLEDRERAAVRKLGVFRGGFTAGAAEEVAGASWELLDALVAQSLIEVDPDTDEPRYRLLEPIRQYTWGLADGPEREATQRRHAAWVVALASQASRQVRLGQALWSERLEAEQGNIEAAIEWSLASPGDESALRIVGYLGFYWFTAGYGQALAWIEQVLDGSDQAPSRLLAGALLGERPWHNFARSTPGRDPPRKVILQV
jgi:predicted ATPase/class 3 adenylate cyclase